MSQAIVKPEDLRRFAAGLKTFSGTVKGGMTNLRGQFQHLSETWRDQEHAKFAQVFDETMKALDRFLKASEQHTPFLIRKAEAAEEYLRRH